MVDVLLREAAPSQYLRAYEEYRPKKHDNDARATRSPEPVSDWSLGFVTGHRLRVVVCMVAVITVLYIAQDFFWPRAVQPVSLVDHIWSWGSLLWLGALIPGTLGLLGMLAYKHPTTLDDVQPLDKLVCFRIVTSGKNINIVLDTIKRCKTEMDRTPLFDYVVEVVVDQMDNVTLLPLKDHRVRTILVPDDYVTPNNTRFKARALHYAMLHSPLPDDAWIVHLDEETQPTSSGIKGISKMIREEEESGRLRVGQGGILYHRAWKEHPFLTLADNVRTGDDFARFHFQHRLGTTVFGIHGSYIVVRNDVEKATGGFDFGPEGDVTEDAFWAVIGMEGGMRCRWVEGYLEEQSTMSFVDFLKQRRRWFHGLTKVALYAPVKLRWRFCVGLNTALWAIAPWAMLYTFAHLAYGFEIRPWVRMLANYSLATFAVLYLTGLKANLDEHGIRSRLQRAYWTVLQIVLLPVFSTMESLAILWAMFSSAGGFHVVKK